MDTDPCSFQAGTSSVADDKIAELFPKKRISPQNLSKNTMTWSTYLFNSQFENRKEILKITNDLTEPKITEEPEIAEEPKDVNFHVESPGSYFSWSTWCTCDQFWYYNYCYHTLKCDDNCIECLLYGEHYNIDMKYGPFLGGIEKKSHKSRQIRPGTEKINKRIQGFNGSVVRGVDLRHLPKWIDQPTYFMTKFMKEANYVDEKGKWRKEPKALEFGVPERQKLVTDEKFGMKSYNVPYSLGKHNRWTFGEFFEENPTEFQHPHQNITTVLMTSTEVPKPQQLYSEQFPPLIKGIQSSYRVKRLIAAESDGKIYTKESRTGKALPVDLIKPVAPLPKQTRQQPKHKKASRRFRRREMLRKKIECQEDPLRLTYVISEPRPTTKQIAADATRQRFTNFLHGKKCPRLQKHRSLLIQPEDEISYNETMDFDLDGTFEDQGFVDDYHPKSPTGMCLSDFIQDSDLSLTPTFVFVNHENGDFIIIGQNQTKRHSSESSSTFSSSYELVDGFNFEN